MCGKYCVNKFRNLKEANNKVLYNFVPVPSYAHNPKELRFNGNFHQLICLLCEGFPSGLPISTLYVFHYF